MSRSPSEHGVHRVHAPHAAGRACVPPYHHPASGVVIPAAETASVPPGFDEAPPLRVTGGPRITSADVGAVNGVRGTYRADGRTNEQVFRQAIVGCVEPNPCENATGEGALAGRLPDQTATRAGDDHLKSVFPQFGGL